jgi:hypothetical protein
LDNSVVHVLHRVQHHHCGCESETRYMSSLRLDCQRSIFQEGSDDGDMLATTIDCTLRVYQAVVINTSTLLMLFIANFVSGMLYEHMLDGIPLITIFRSTLGKAGKSLWGILFIAEVTSAIWLGLVRQERSSWLEVLLALNFGVIVNLVHWIVLFIIFKLVKGILSWRKKVQEKRIRKSSSSC